MVVDRFSTSRKPNTDRYFERYILTLRYSCHQQLERGWIGINLSNL
jgi:hypothetical protein